MERTHLLRAGTAAVSPQQEVQCESVAVGPDGALSAQTDRLYTTGHPRSMAAAA
ncbi:MAG: hypothetical protein LBE67_01770 [Kocuria palustris]|nr:hypothetical protein [Kocuria palustris]